MKLLKNRSKDTVCLPDQDKGHVRAGESCWVAGFGSFYDASRITNANASILEPDLYGYESRFGEIELKTIADRDCRKSNVSSSGFRYGRMFCSG